MDYITADCSQRRRNDIRVKVFRKSNVEKDFNEAIRIFEENKQKEEQEAEQETVEISDDTDNEDVKLLIYESCRQGDITPEERDEILADL